MLCKAEGVRREGSRFAVRQLCQRLAGGFGSRELSGRAHETENEVRLGVLRIIQRKENAPEFDYSSFYGKTGTGRPAALWWGLSVPHNVPSLCRPRGDRAPYRTKIPFRVRTPTCRTSFHRRT